MTRSTSNARGRRLGLIIVVILVIAGAFALRFHELGQTRAVANIHDLRATEGAPVETIRAEARELSTWTTLAGTVKGIVQYPVVSNNALRVQSIPVREGNHVATGDVLLHLVEEAPSPMFHSVAQARAAHQSALADARRLRNLYAEGAVSRQELDHAETRLAVAAAQLADAEGSTALRASEPGIVTAVLTEVGATVSSGRTLMWIARTDTVKAVFQAGSRQALELALGQQAVWIAPEGTRHIGSIGRLDLMADPATHLLEGEALFANPDGRLLPGLLVSFDVRTRHRAEALAVPRESVVGGAENPAVWVVDMRKDTPTARLRPVGIGMTTTEAVEITSGLEPGEVVVRFGHTLLQDGAPVRIVTADKEG